MSTKVKKLNVNLALTCEECKKPIDESFSFCPYCGKVITVRKYNLSLQSKYFREYVAKMNRLLEEFQSSIKYSKLEKNYYYFTLYKYNPKSLDGNFEEIPLVKYARILPDIVSKGFTDKEKLDRSRSIIKGLVNLYSKYPNNIKIYITSVTSVCLDIDVYYIFDTYAVPFYRVRLDFKNVCTSFLVKLANISTISKSCMSDLEYLIDVSSKDLKSLKEVLKYQQLMYKFLKVNEVECEK